MSPHAHIHSEVYALVKFFFFFFNIHYFHMQWITDIQNSTKDTC